MVFFWAGEMETPRHARRDASWPILPEMYHLVTGCEEKLVQIVQGPAC